MYVCACGLDFPVVFFLSEMVNKVEYIKSVDVRRKTCSVYARLARWQLPCNICKGEFTGKLVISA